MTVKETVAKRLRQIEVDAIKDYSEEMFGNPKDFIKWEYLTDNEKSYWYMRATQILSQIVEEIKGCEMTDEEIGAELKRQGDYCEADIRPLLQAYCRKIIKRLEER